MDCPRSEPPGGQLIKDESVIKATLTLFDITPLCLIFSIQLGVFSSGYSGSQFNGDLLAFVDRIHDFTRLARIADHI